MGRYKNPAPQVVLPVKTFDLVGKGDAGTWDAIVRALHDETNLEQLSREHLLPLVISYDISRIRKVADYPHDLAFIDSSWLSHGYSHWSDDPEMARWLKALGEVSRHRVNRGLRTSRVFYWRPDEVVAPTQLQSICGTILGHVHAGIDVTLVEPRHLPVLDAQRFSTKDALISRSWANLDIEQLVGSSQVEEVSDRIELVRGMVQEGEAIHFEPNARLEDVYRRVGERCANLRGVVGRTG
jgi:hypothetical protein